MSWLPGKTLKNRTYQIEKEIGEGGFGLTYKAKHLELDSPVVIKTPNARLRRDANYPKFVEGFRKEGKILAKISHENPHPNIVYIRDLFEEEDLPCLVMNFVPGENLYYLVQKQGRLSESTAIEYIKQIASALSSCHQAGIIHRDAHPGNMILREKTDKVVLIDFGLAGNVNTQSINQSANQAFAPWEQMIEGEKAVTIDVYTIAASLFYLVTGETPTPSLARKLMNKPLEPPIKYNGKISSGLNEAILKGLELEAGNRPQSIEKWVELLGDRGYQGTERLSNFEYVVGKIEVKQTGLFGGNTEIKVKRYSQKGKCFIEELGNKVKLEMVEIPGGEFVMGAPKEESATSDHQRPQHQVTVRGFFMGKYPVTQVQWREVTKLPQINRELKSEPSHFKGDNRPVDNVSWYDAVEFCARLSRHMKREYRLPSEAEWEYACRAGTKTPFHFGETITAEVANYNANYIYGKGVKGEYREETTEVGKYGVGNEYGLYEMHGNVWEWCLDDWHNNYEGAPNDERAWFEDENENLYQKQDRAVLRGGSWNNSPDLCRSAIRVRSARDYANNNLGFRVVLSGVARTL